VEYLDMPDPDQQKPRRQQRQPESIKRKIIFWVTLLVVLTAALLGAAWIAGHPGTPAAKIGIWIAIVLFAIVASPLRIVIRFALVMFRNRQEQNRRS
jgi:hypothetical protein